MPAGDVVIIAVAVLTFLAGVAVGVFVASRNAHRLVARLPLPEQVAFAKKVSATRR